MIEEDRRSSATQWSGVSGVIAIIYTIGFMVLAGLLYFFPLPETNKDALLYLFGILSGIELTIIAFYFGGSQTVEATQRAVVQSKARADAVVQEIARAAPAAVAVAAAAGATTLNGTKPETETYSTMEQRP